MIAINKRKTRVSASFPLRKIGSKFIDVMTFHVNTIHTMWLKILISAICPIDIILSPITFHNVFSPCHEKQLKSIHIAGLFYFGKRCHFPGNIRQNISISHKKAPSNK